MKQSPLLNITIWFALAGLCIIGLVIPDASDAFPWALPSVAVALSVVCLAFIVWVLCG